MRGATKNEERLYFNKWKNVFDGRQLLLFTDNKLKNIPFPFDKMVPASFWQSALDWHSAPETAMLCNKQ